jgi:hypothetical protein
MKAVTEPKFVSSRQHATRVFEHRKVIGDAM